MHFIIWILAALSLACIVIAGGCQFMTPRGDVTRQGGTVPDRFHCDGMIWEEPIEPTPDPVGGTRLRQSPSEPKPKLPSIVEQTVRCLGGWYALRQSESASALTAQFRDAFLGLVEQQRNDQQCLALDEKEPLNARASHTLPESSPPPAA